MNYEEVKELISIFEKTDLNDMELTIDNTSIRLNRSKINCMPMPGFGMAPEGMPAAQNVNVACSEENKNDSKAVQSVSKDTEKVATATITAPIVGNFYAASSPDKPAFVKPGDKVKKGDVVCIIEAMKFMNEIQSEVDGVIDEVLVQDGDFVEFGQDLFSVK